MSDLMIEQARNTPQQKRYCVLCGLGFGEFMACELPDCRLESDEEVAERLQLRRPQGQE